MRLAARATAGQAKRTPVGAVARLEPKKAKDKINNTMRDDTREEIPNSILCRGGVSRVPRTAGYDDDR